MLTTADLEALQRYIENHPEDTEAKDRLSRYTQAIQVNPLLRFEPHEKQKAFYEAGRIRYKMFAGGNQSGKTLGGIVDDLIQCCDEDSLPKHLRPYKFWEPPFRCRVITPSFGKTLSSFQEKLKEWLPLNQLVGGSWDQAYKLKDEELHFKNGSYIQFMSGDQDVVKFSAWTGDRVHFDEETPGEHGFEIFKESKPRMMIRHGQIMFTMTPAEGVTWTGDQIWEKRGEENYFGIQVDMDDNPALTEEEKAITLEGYTDEEIRARKSGEFVYLKGKIYPEFDTRTHILRETPSKDHIKSLDNIVVIDPGLERMAVAWLGFDSDNRALMYDEIYEKDINVEIAVDLINEKNEEWGLDDPMYVIDPTSQNRNATNQTGIDQAFFQHGIFPIFGQNDVDVGIFQVKRRLQATPAAFIVTHDCENFLKEVKRYRWHVIDTPSGRKRVPYKKDDHLCDAVRYGMMERFWGAEPKVKARRKQSTTSFQIPYEQERQYAEVGPLGPMA